MITKFCDNKVSDFSLAEKHMDCCSDEEKITDRPWPSWTSFRDISSGVPMANVKNLSKIVLLHHFIPVWSKYPPQHTHTHTHKTNTHTHNTPTHTHTQHTNTHTQHTNTHTHNTTHHHTDTQHTHTQHTTHTHTTHRHTTHTHTHTQYTHTRAHTRTWAPQSLKNFAVPRGPSNWAH
jgi:hypothetical protein